MSTRLSFDLVDFAGLAYRLRIHVLRKLMKLDTRTSLLFVLIALFTLQEAHAQTRSQATGVEPDYLVFQMGADDKDFATVLPELKAEFGAKPAGGTRYVGFGVALMTLKTPIEELRRQVTRALNSAEETGLPVLIKLDELFDRTWRCV